MWKLIKAEFFTKEAWLALAVFFVIDIGTIWLFNDVVILKKLFPIRPEIGVYVLAIFIYFELYGDNLKAMDENRTKLHALLPMSRINLNVSRLLIPLLFVILYIISLLLYLSLTAKFVDQLDYFFLIMSVFIVLASYFGLGFYVEFVGSKHRRGVGNFILHTFGMMIPYLLLFNLVNDPHNIYEIEGVILVVPACLIITAIYIVLTYKGFKGRKSFLS